jgi:hypothetical protein
VIIYLVSIFAISPMMATILAETCGAWRSHALHHITRHNTPIHNILLTAPQLNISQKALGTLLEDGNVMPKHLGATIHN